MHEVSQAGAIGSLLAILEQPGIITVGAAVVVEEEFNIGGEELVDSLPRLKIRKMRGATLNCKREVCVSRDLLFAFNLQLS